MRLVAALVMLFSLSGCALAQTAFTMRAPGDARFFHQVGDGPRAVETLNSGPAGGAVRAVELYETGAPVTGDTLVVWIKHCGPSDCYWPPESEYADLLISCYPAGLKLVQRLRHAFPTYDGLVWLYEAADGDFAITPGEGRSRVSTFRFRGDLLPHFRHRR